jgi:hypothetical protein
MMALVSASGYIECQNVIDIVVLLAIGQTERHGMSHTQPCISPYYTQEHHTDRWHNDEQHNICKIFFVTNSSHEGCCRYIPLLTKTFNLFYLILTNYF